jgi:hypothetical protein
VERQSRRIKAGCSPNEIVNRLLPPADFPTAFECIFQRVDDEFCDYQAQAFSVATGRCATFTDDFQNDGLIVADHGA